MMRAQIAVQVALSVFVLLTGIIAKADVYGYGGTRLVCRLEADRQEIGVPVKMIGKPIVQTFAFQLFKSESYSPRMTAYAQGSRAFTEKFFEAGGIPNSQAQINWSVLDNRTYFESNIQGAGRNWLKFSLGKGQIEAQLQILWDLEDYQTILYALGDTQTPNFKKDPPVVDASSQNQIQYARTEVGFSESASPIASELMNPNTLESTFSQVQIHYPAEKHNGLSYHIRLSCIPNM